jgi:hypothetical protein
VFHSSTSTLLSVEQPAATVNYLPVDWQRLENALHAWLLCQKLERGRPTMSENTMLLVGAAAFAALLVVPPLLITAPPPSFA